MIRPTIFEKLSFKLAKWIGSPISLILHTVIFGGFFIFRYLGFVTNSVLLVLTAAVCLEAIYLVINVSMIIRNNTRSLLEVQEKITQMQQEEEDAHKLLINMLHLAHQMKTIQHDIDVLKKGGVLKHNGNGHRIHI